MIAIDSPINATYGRCASRVIGSIGRLFRLALWVALTGLSLAGPATPKIEALGRGETRPKESKPVQSASIAVVEVRDSYNRLVQLPQTPNRIVSCAPNMTEIVSFIGEGKRLVGRTDWCNWPPEVSAIPSVGGLQDPNIEKILSLKPNVVLASTHFQKETLEILESVRIPVFMGVVHREYGEVYELIRRVGVLLGVPEKADRKARELEERIESIRRRTEPLSPKPSVY